MATPITGVNNGDDATDTWPDAVTTELNRQQDVALTADVSKAASSWSDVTGLSVPVVSGKRYRIRLTATWQNGSTGGVRIGFDFPTGSSNFRGLMTYTGETAPDALVHEWHTTTDDGAGVTSVDVSSTPRFARFDGRYRCGTTGTLKVRYYRNGAGTTTIEDGSFLEVLADS